MLVYFVNGKKVEDKDEFLNELKEIIWENFNFDEYLTKKFSTFKLGHFQWTMFELLKKCNLNDYYLFEEEEKEELLHQISQEFENKDGITKNIYGIEFETLSI